MVYGCAHVMYSTSSSLHGDVILSLIRRRYIGKHMFCLHQFSRLGLLSRFRAVFLLDWRTYRRFGEVSCLSV
jgi:hypothetical protein